MWRKFTRLFSLCLFVSSLLTAQAALAQKNHRIPKKNITDAAGRTHVRPVGRISDAQRKAAAQRRKAIRAKQVPTGKKVGVRK